MLRGIRLQFGVWQGQRRDEAHDMGHPTVHHTESNRGPEHSVGMLLLHKRDPATETTSKKQRAHAFCLDRARPTICWTG